MANVANGTYEVDPISRIEGHLGVKVTVGATGITEANAHGNLWRGFENFLIGRNANDAITFTQRICGVCPVPHGLAATHAADAVLGVSDGYCSFMHQAGTAVGDKGVPAKAVLIRNLVLGAEFLMSSITHFYHLAALSYVQGPPIPPWTPCFADIQYSPKLIRLGHGAKANGAAAGPAEDGVLPLSSGPLSGGGGYSVDLWSAVIKQYVKALRIRRLTFEAGALFAGRMPMTSCFVAGGVTNMFRDAADFNNRCDKFRAIIAEVGNFVVEEYIPTALALGALYPGFDNAAGADGYGAGLGNYLAWGGFPAADATGTLAVPGGIVFKDNVVSAPIPLLTNRASLAAAKTKVQNGLVEVITRSRYANTNGYETSEWAYPGSVTRTEPKRDTEAKYSWMKAPRWKITTANTASCIFAGTDLTTTVTIDAGGADARAITVTGAAVTSTRTNATTWSVTRASVAAVPNGTYPVTYDVLHALEVGPLARLVVGGKYPLGSALVAGGYADLYLNGASLDTRVISADLVNALVNEGLIVGNDLTDPLGAYLAGLKCGRSTIDRLRARALESFWMVTWMLGAYDKVTLVGGRAKGFPKATTDLGAAGWIADLKALGVAALSYRHVAPTTAQLSGFGMVEAPRGALAHFATAAAGGKLVQYQCVVPTTWNGSPKDGVDGDTRNRRGAIEQAMIGAPFGDYATDNGSVSGVEVLRIAQSFDPCIACAVH